MTTTQPDARLDAVRQSPAGAGTVELIVRRPQVEARELLDEAELTPEQGLVGDRWSQSRRPNPGAQLTLMNARAVELVAGPDREQWALAGDQLYVDLDLSEASLPAGTRLAVGSAVVEVTALPHLGCEKFARRYGAEARTFVNSEEGVALRLRGVNARVVEAGTVRRGDPIRTL